MPTFRNTVCSIFIGGKVATRPWRWDSVPKRRHIKFRRQGNTPEESVQHSEHGESLKSRNMITFVMHTVRCGYTLVTWIHPHAQILVGTQKSLGALIQLEVQEIWAPKQSVHILKGCISGNKSLKCIYSLMYCCAVECRGVFRPRQTRQLPRAVDLKGQLLSCQSY